MRTRCYYRFVFVTRFCHEFFPVGRTLIAMNKFQRWQFIIATGISEAYEIISEEEEEKIAQPCQHVLAFSIVV